MKDTKKNTNAEPTELIGQISFDDILASIDDGTYGKPSDEFMVADDE